MMGEDTDLAFLLPITQAPTAFQVNRLLLPTEGEKNPQVLSNMKQKHNPSILSQNLHFTSKQKGDDEEARASIGNKLANTSRNETPCFQLMYAGDTVGNNNGNTTQVHVLFSHLKPRRLGLTFYQFQYEVFL